MSDALPITEVKAAPRVGWAVFVVLLALLGTGFASVHRVKEARAQGYPLVVTDPTKLDFGDRKAGEKFVWTVTVHNRTEQTVSVDKLRASCDCLSASTNTLSLPPKSVADIMMTIALSKGPARKVIAVEAFDESGAVVLSTSIYGKVTD